MKNTNLKAVHLAVTSAGDVPYQPASFDIWDKKYRLKQKDGTAIDQAMDDTYQRVARALSEVEAAPEAREHWYERFLWALRRGAIPAGRIISNAGAWDHKPATSTINCTVSGTIHDSMDDILGKVHEAGLTLKAGCVAPGTLVLTEHGLVTADRAVEERHARILCYDRERRRFEMRPILRHLITHVPQEENIEIRCHGSTLTTSARHPVLVYREGELVYARADEVRSDDALIQFSLPWDAEQDGAMDAWLAGAHAGAGSASAKLHSSPTWPRDWLHRVRVRGERLIFMIRAAEREVVGRCAAFCRASFGSPARVAVAATPHGHPVWDCNAAGFEASPATPPIGHRVGQETGEERVPRSIAEHPERYFLPFLGGLVDRDGTVSRENGGVSIGVRSRRFAEDLRGLLGLFGVRAVIGASPARSTVRQGQVVRDDGGAEVNICDPAFLARVGQYMADNAKRARIQKCAASAGCFDTCVLPRALGEALQGEAAALGYEEHERLGFVHGHHRRHAVSRVWLDRWEVRFPHLAHLIGFARTLRPVEGIRRGLDVPETFYDFTVQEHNNYLAGNGGLSVLHNCGIGYEFSTLRPRGAYVSGAGAYTSGPLSFMDIYDKMCFTVSSAGGRRGAQMGTFDVSHPDVMSFIRAKRESGRLRQFNLSLLVTEEFMEAVKHDAAWSLAFPLRRQEVEADGVDLTDPEKVVWRDWPVKEGYVVNDAGKVACKVYKTLRARRLWDVIMSSTYDYAEPGFVLIDKVNEMNNNWWCENIRATNPCVTADTRLHTQYGLIPIGELYAAGAPLEVTVDKRALGGTDKGTLVRRAVPAFMTAREADVYRVETADGYEIKATAWHDFYTARGKIELKDLQPDDELLVQSGKGQFGTEGGAELGMLIGLITGDGHFTHRGHGENAAIVNFWNEDRTLAPVVASYINSLIAGLAQAPGHYEVSPVAVAARNHAFIRSVLLARFLDHYGFTAATKHSVPEVIWRGTEECVRSYLRGLFQADGTVNISGNGESCSIRLASSYPTLLKDVQRLLANFGIFCRIRKRREARERLMPDGKGGAECYACGADYDLIIDGESREHFMEEIGFLAEGKSAKYREWVKDKILRKTQRFTTRVTNIVYTGKAPVFDTTQADHNTVIFNGLVTGQCGEQPLPEYGACLLGSVNLTQFVRDPFTDRARFDWEEFREVVAVFTRMLDNVVEVNGLPLEKQREEIYRKRRHGMGYLGLGSTLTMLRQKYGSPESLELTEQVTRELALVGWESALALSREKGPAPIMEEEFEVTPEMLVKRPEMAADDYTVGDKVKGKVLHARYSRYMQQVAKVAPELVDALAEMGARFTHHSSIAPTGTISLSLANNASNGIEPSFAHHYFRNVIREGKKSKEKVDVYSFELLAYRHLVSPRASPQADGEDERLPDYFVTAEDITPEEHVDIQAAAQKWIDSSISKTANVPTDYPYEDFKGIYLYAYEKGLKGCTTFRFNPEAFQGVLVKEKDLENTIYRFTLDDGSIVEAKGNEEIEYDGEVHTAANLFDAIKEGYYGKF